MKFSGAGLLIFEVTDTNDLRLVLFHDKEKQAYVDPGGCMEHAHRNNPQTTAIIELFEETACLLKVDNPDVLSRHYIEREVNRKDHRPDGWYRSYILFTRPLDKKDYQANVKHLREMNAPHSLQETDDMVRISVEELYRTVRGDKNFAKVVDSKSTKVRLHKRIKELLQEMFRDATWIFKVMNESKINHYKKTEQNGLTMYEYK